MVLLISLVSLVLSAHADKEGVVEPKTNVEILDSRWPVPQGNGYVKEEILCIRNKAAKTDLIKREDAEQMILALAPAMEEGFKKANISRLERALIYSQAIQETGGFTILNEATGYKTKIGASGIAHLAKAAADDEAFKGVIGSENSRSLGEYRGKGIFQVTGCENYLSLIDYMNQIEAEKSGGAKPRWRSGWQYQVGEKIEGGKKVRDMRPTPTFCPPEIRRPIADEYERRTKMQADLYGAWSAPEKFGMLDAKFTDQLTKEEKASEQFMVDASMAYWRGNCGETVATVSNSQKLMNEKTLCQALRKDGDDYAAYATRCLTKCIKGDTDSSDKRERWLRIAISCLNKNR